MDSKVVLFCNFQKLMLTFLVFIMGVMQVLCINPQQITFRFYTGRNANQYQTIPFKNFQNIVNNPQFNRLLPTRIYIGGYTETRNLYYTVDLINSLIQRTVGNVIQLVWSPYNMGSPSSAISNCRQLAPQVATKMDQLVANGVLPFQLFIYCNSLGAQLAGIMGLDMKNKAAIMFAMDPWGPGFPINQPHLSNNFNSVTKQKFQSGSTFVEIASIGVPYNHPLDILYGRSAQYVVSVHTDSNGRGTSLTDADLNFFINGGTEIQPGCPPLNQATNRFQRLCSHIRAIRISYYYNLYPLLFFGVPCKSYQQFTQHRSSCGVPIPLIAENTLVRGFYYFNTSGTPPYGLGLGGV